MPVQTSLIIKVRTYLSRLNSTLVPRPCVSKGMQLLIIDFNETKKSNERTVHLFLATSSVWSVYLNFDPDTGNFYFSTQRRLTHGADLAHNKVRTYLSRLNSTLVPRPRVSSKGMQLLINDFNESKKSNERTVYHFLATSSVWSVYLHFDPDTGKAYFSKETDIWCRLRP